MVCAIANGIRHIKTFVGNWVFNEGFGIAQTDREVCYRMDTVI